MTVYELRKALEGVDGDMEVITIDSDDPYFLQMAISAEIETVITKPSPSSPKSPWFWSKDQSSDIRSGGTDVKVFLIY